MEGPGVEERGSGAGGGLQLTAVEVRVLGSLMEKEATTPDSYPLSLNALTGACNQSSNREPVMQLEEGEVARTIEHLRERGLVRAVQKMDARVAKYHHLLSERWSLDARERAALGVLMLRGPQTAGEIRTRTARMADFATPEDLERTLTLLSLRDPALAVRLPRQPGQKEARWAHLLSGAPAPEAAPTSAVEPPAAATRVDERVAALEATIDALRQEVAALRGEFDAFRAQFG